MPTIAVINERCATLPPHRQLTNADLGAINEVWGQPIARAAVDIRALLNIQTSEVITSALRGMGSFTVPAGFTEQSNAAISQLAIEQVNIASHAAEMPNGLSATAWQDAVKGVGLTGASAIAAGAMQAFDMVSAVERMQLPIDSMANSLVRAVANAAQIDLSSPVFSPYSLPALHIRRGPPSPPAEPRLLTPSTQRPRVSRIGRPRGSYGWYPERVVQIYKQLACSGRYVTQEQLALELGITLRTLQRWLTIEHMNLGWPPRQ